MAVTEPQHVCCVCQGGQLSYYVTALSGNVYCGPCASEHSLDLRGLAAPRAAKAVTAAPAQFCEFIDHLKARGVRTAKGEFVASDGTRLPYDFTFEREREQPRKGREE